MIKINDRFSMERDSECWTLFETVHGVNPRTKTPSVNIRKRYFPTLHTIIGFMLDLAPTEAQSLSDLVRVIDAAKADIYRAIMGGANKP
jgi:hypothetical protein